MKLHASNVNWFTFRCGNALYLSRKKCARLQAVPGGVMERPCRRRDRQRCHEHFQKIKVYNTTKAAENRQLRTWGLRHVQGVLRYLPLQRGWVRRSSG